MDVVGRWCVVWCAECEKCAKYRVCARVLRVLSLQCVECNALDTLYSVNVCTYSTPSGTSLTEAERLIPDIANEGTNRERQECDATQPQSHRSKTNPHHLMAGPVVREVVSG